MRVLFWYCDRIQWTPAMKTVEDAPEGQANTVQKVVAAFVHVEPRDFDEERRSKVETKLVKNCKWLASKWKTRHIVLHSFTHLGEDKATPEQARELFDSAKARLEKVDYTVTETPFGYFLDIEMKAPGHPLARIYKEF